LSSVSVLHGVANVTELEDSAELLGLAELLDFTLLLDVTLDEDSFPSGREIKSLSSSLQAASIIVPTRIPSQKCRIFSPKKAYLVKKGILDTTIYIARMIYKSLRASFSFSPLNL
jgi:hypothetical protein